MTTAATDADLEWQPGDPLYSNAPYKYLFNFRDDPDTEDCRCSDSASWPDPGPIRSRHIEDDPLADFIAEYHAYPYQPRNA